MTFLPVVERELRVAARRRGVFWTRLLAASLAVLVGGVVLWFEAEGRGPSVVGRILFDTLTNLAFVFCLTAGPIFTADILSEERREGTLGLLFLTDLRGYDVVAGKLVAASVTALFSLLATLPVLAIPLLLGGVPLVEFGRVALALGNTLFFSLAVGVLVSAGSTEARSAFAVTVFILFLFAGFAAWLAPLCAGMPLARGLLSANPTSMLRLATQPPASQALVGFWWAFAGTHAGAWLCLLGAAGLTQRAWREHRSPRRASSWRDRWQALSFGSAAHRHAFRARLLDRNPILWLGSRNRLKLIGLWTFVSFALGLWIAWRWGTGPSADTWSSTFFIALLLQAPLKWLMASEASQRWVAERQSGALELLLTTPLSVTDILHGHGRSLARLFGVPALALVTVELLTLVAGGGFSEPRLEIGAMTVAGAILFLWDLYALAWVGLWLGLSRRKPNQAFVGTGVRILVLPWFVCLVALFFTGLQSTMTFPVLWFIVCGGCNLAFQYWAKANLRELLRDVAGARFSAASAPAG